MRLASPFLSLFNIFLMRHNYYFLAAPILLGSLFISSCDEASDDCISLAVSKEALSNKLDSAVVSVSASSTWVLTGIPSWMTVTPTYGWGDATLKVTVEPNEAFQGRQATLVAKSGTNSVSIVLSQAETVNTNVNAAGSIGSVALRLEVPHVNAENTFVAHYATVARNRRLNYCYEWNSGLKHAAWVAYTMDRLTSQSNVQRQDNFQPDPELPEQMRTTNANHTSDGFDRGHICPSADRLYSTEMNLQTFYFSNMSPMLHDFNSGIWGAMESKVREWGRATQTGKYDTLYVVKGGTIDDRLVNFVGTKMGQDRQTPTTDADGMTVKGLACPANYFMAVLPLTNGQYSAIGFLVPHDDTITPIDGGRDFTVADIRRYEVTIDRLEEQTGLDFFCNLPDEIENMVESAIGSFWD